MEAASHSDPLVILIDLEKRIRSVSELNELKFVFVNETHGLVPYPVSYTHLTLPTICSV